MKNKKKRILLYVCIIFVLFSIISGIFLHFWSKTEAGSRFLFEWDYKQMKQVADYLIQQDENSDMTILTRFGYMLMGPGETEWIDDFETRIVVFLLFAKGYDRIEKNDGKTICFERWYDGFERFRGFALSVDGSDELSVEYLIDQKTMPKENWYYYIDDYNEWRVLNS